MTDNEREKTVQMLLARLYTKIIRGEAKDGFLGEVAELPGCLTAGETEQEVLVNLREAMAAWLEAALIAGRPIPEPKALGNVV